MKKTLIFLSLTLALVGCQKEPSIEEAEQMVRDMLKTASGISLEKLSHKDAFSSSEKYQIPLPSDANIIKNSLDAINGQSPTVATDLTNKLDSMKTILNRTAEVASPNMLTIFNNTIQNTNVTDPLSLLKAKDTVATHFFRKNAFNTLKTEVEPKISEAMGKNIDDSPTATAYWTKLTDTYNNYRTSSEGSPLNLEEMPSNEIKDFATNSALKGIFNKIGEEEVNIKNDPASYGAMALENLLH